MRVLGRLWAGALTIIGANRAERAPFRQQIGLGKPQPPHRPTKRVLGDLNLVLALVHPRQRNGQWIGRVLLHC